MPCMICPSILAADFAHLADEVQRAEKAGADAVHVDIMDGHFVPNISIGPNVVAAIKRSTKLPLHVHLMLYNPFDYIEQFVRAGASQISFHFEATEDVEETLKFITRCGIKAGLALNPETSISFLPKYFPLIDEVLLMSVHPGFGGQEFIPETLSKIEELRSYMGKENIAIAVDGGINDKTAVECARAGATILTAGTYFFSQKDMAQAISRMRSATET